MKKWDLPKGKLDKGETIKECATREVEEETKVKVECKEKIISTWHTYTRNKKFILMMVLMELSLMQELQILFFRQK